MRLAFRGSIDMDAWVEQELNAGVYPDRRLQSRLGQLLGDLGQRFGDTIPLATQDWAGAKAAYRFLSNPRVDEECILSGHLAATRARFDASPGTVLVLHDTTAFSFQRRDPAGFGRLKLIKGRHPSLSLTVLHADEPGAPAGRDAIHWQLLTDLPVDDLASAVEKRDWYAMRWKIETFHKVLKSGGRAEESRLRTAERLTNLLAVLCVVGWRVFWLTMLNRAAPDEPAGTAFNPAEVGVLDRLTGRSPTRRTVAHYVLAVAKLGGYLARAKDPPPGNEVIWRGLSRLADISLGAELMDQSCG